MTAAVGMAAGAGLWLLVLTVVVLHVISSLGYDVLAKRINSDSPDP